MSINTVNIGKLAVLLLVWATAFAPIVPAMVNNWFNHSDNSHALLVPLVSLYFIWEKRKEIRSVQIKGSNAGLLLLTLCLLIYIVSFVGGIAFFCRLMLVASLIAIVWGSLGTAMLRLLAFPLGFLFFMIPVPDTLLSLVSFPLQLLATKISADLISYCSIPVYREGNMLFFLNTQLEVAEACSGIRSIMSLTIFPFSSVNFPTYSFRPPKSKLSASGIAGNDISLNSADVKNIGCEGNGSGELPGGFAHNRGEFAICSPLVVRC